MSVRVTNFARKDVVLNESPHKFSRHFLVGMAHEDRLLIVRYRIVFKWSCISRHLDRTEKVLDFLFHLVNIDVTYDYDTLKIRTIPLSVVVAKFAILEVVDNFDSTDRKAFAILAAWIDLSTMLFDHASDSIAKTPFFVDNAAFLVDFGIFKKKCACPVVKDKHT